MLSVENNPVSFFPVLLIDGEAFASFGSSQVLAGYVVREFGEGAEVLSRDAIYRAQSYCVGEHGPGLVCVSGRDKYSALR